MDKVDSIQSEQKLEKTLILVLKLRNPFDTQKFKPSDMISVYKARKKFYRVFKALPCKSAEAILPVDVKNNIWWISTKLSYSESKKKKIPWHQFQISLISTVLYFIKIVLGFEYFLLESRNGDEIFCKIYASEATLRHLASLSDYNLKFKHKGHKWNKKFQIIPPYGPIWLDNIQKNQTNLFVKYDEKGQENFERGSLFKYVDKVRISCCAISEVMDLYVLKSYDIMNDEFCYHESAPLKELKNDWATLAVLFKAQPLDKIHNYFSENIAFYFAWMQEYEYFMFICSIVGTFTFITLILCSHMKNDYLYLLFQILFCLFLAVWATVFNQTWTRQEHKYAWEWGVSNLDKQDVQREKFKGVYGMDEVTGKMKVLPKKHKLNFVKTSSYLCIAFILILIIVSVIVFFKFRIIMKEDPYWKQWPIVTALIYAIQITIFDLVYTLVAEWLNDRENHETTNQYNNHLAFKLFLFRFVNSYAGLFYIAFFKQYLEKDGCGENGCMYELGFQLCVIFITNLILNIIELGLPWVLSKVRLMFEEYKSRHRIAQQHRENLYKIEIEARLEPYSNPIEDYMEMAIQFGFVALFGSSFPLIGVLALIEIVIEIRVDAWKLCYLTKRPDPVRSRNIGIWKNIIFITANVGIVTNAAIVVFTSEMLDGYDIKMKIIVFIILEHIFLIGMAVATKFIPDKSKVCSKGIKWSNRKVIEKIIGKHMRKTKISDNKLKDNFLITPKDISYHY